MKDEGRGGWIEQLRVVDAKHDRTLAGAPVELLAAASHQRDEIIGANLVGNQVGDRRERYGRRTARGLDPADEGAVAFRGGLCLPNQARLANAGARDDDDAVAPAVGPGRGDCPELLVAADQRPQSGERDVR